jgi:uncharacterized delta-60 repeat protein
MRFFKKVRLDFLFALFCGFITSVSISAQSSVTLDSFNPDVNDTVRALAMQPDNKIIIGGSFITVSGQTRNRLARINSDGTLDSSFNPNADDKVNAVTLQSDGKILVGGMFTSVGGTGRDSLARLNPDGTLDTSFNANILNNDLFFPTDVKAIVLQRDGKIIICGLFRTIAGQERRFLARLNADGSFDNTFKPNINGTVFTAVEQPDGKILIGGQFIVDPGQPRNHLARLNADGSLDNNFNPGADGDVTAFAIEPDGQILVGGSFSSIAGQEQRRIARLNTNGTFDTSFRPTMESISFVNTIALQANGKILIGGFFGYFINGRIQAYIGRLNADGSIDDSFNLGTDGEVFALQIQPDGKVLVGGFFLRVGSQTRNRLARLNNNTPVSQTLSANQNAIVWSSDGAFPDFSSVSFEQSTDGVNYTPLGSAARFESSSNWILTGLSLPTNQNLFIRARGVLRTGQNNGSQAIIESVQNVFLSATPIRVSVRGRVLNNQSKNFTARQLVALTDSQGNSRLVLTNQFGYYNFSGVLTGEIYTVKIFSKKHSFASQLVAVGTNIINLDFIPR